MGGSKKVRNKIKIKIPAYIRLQTHLIPLNAASSGRELSEICSVFALGQSEHRHLTARIDGIDRAFLFGNAWLPLLAKSLSSFLIFRILHQSVP